MGTDIQLAQQKMRTRQERMHRVKASHHWLPNEKDAELMAKLQTKLGISKQDVLRQALRVLAEKEGIL